MWDTIVAGATSLGEPLWQTPLAVANTLGVAEATTFLFSLFLFVAALEVLRASAGILVHGARLVALLAAGLASASLVYGDFLLPPAKAALTMITARLPQQHTQTAIAATIGVATIGAAYRAGKVSAATSARRASNYRASRMGSGHASARSGGRVSEPDRVLALDTTRRLHMRQLAHNPKKAPTRQVKLVRTHVPARHWG